MTIEEKLTKFRDEIVRLTIQGEQLAFSNRQLREELEKVKSLASRTYPDLKASSICSAHSDDGHFDCETCYPNWKELAKAHCDLKQKAWTALAAAKEALEKANFVCCSYPVEITADELKDSLVEFAETTIEPALALIAASKKPE